MHFSDLGDLARTWIFLASRELTDKEIVAVKERGNHFVHTWQSHGKNVTGAFDIFYNRFLVFFADLQISEVTACAVDKSFDFIKSVENEFKITLLNRNLVAYRDAGEIKITEINRLRSALHPDDFHSIQFFNTYITTKGELLRNFEIPVRGSWLEQLLNLPVHEPV